jgi:hypothetical protein
MSQKQTYLLFLCMRTTVIIKDDLFRQAKKPASEEGRTLTSLIEEGLVVTLAKSKGNRRKQVHLPVSKATGGVLPRG